MSQLGDRMKAYEQIEAGRLFIPRLPIIVRVDGRSFGNFTRGMNKPFDQSFRRAMIDTTRILVEKTNPRIAYTQSDEITLIYQANGPRSEVMFGGKVHKMTSVIASMASVGFMLAVKDHFPNWEYLQGKFPHFDCRCWNVPDQNEAVNNLVDREQDAVRNSISMLARAHFSHSQLNKKTGSEKQEMLHKIGINWNDVDRHFKRGTYLQTRQVKRKLTTKEITKIPSAHRPDPDVLFTRTAIMEIDMPPITKVVNRIEVAFDKADPKVEELTHA